MQVQDEDKDKDEEEEAAYRMVCYILGNTSGRFKKVASAWRLEEFSSRLD